MKSSLLSFDTDKKKADKKNTRLSHVLSPMDNSHLKKDKANKSQLTQPARKKSLGDVGKSKSLKHHTSVSNDLKKDIMRATLLDPSVDKRKLQSHGSPSGIPSNKIAD